MNQGGEILSDALLSLQRLRHVLNPVEETPQFPLLNRMVSKEECYKPRCSAKQEISFNEVELKTAYG